MPAFGVQLSCRPAWVQTAKVSPDLLYRVYFQKALFSIRSNKAKLKLLFQLILLTSTPGATTVVL